MVIPFIFLLLLLVLSMQLITVTKNERYSSSTLFTTQSTEYQPTNIFINDYLTLF